MHVPKYKDWWDLTFTDDYMFKCVMKNKRICINTLNRFLPWHIRDIAYYEDEKPLQSHYEGKGVRLDVYVEDDVHRSYDLEMQVRKIRERAPLNPADTSEPSIVMAKRMRFYQGELDVDQLVKGGLYSELRPTVIMFFCPFKVFDGSRHVYRFKTVCVDDPNLVFPDEVEKIVISSKGSMNDVSPDVQSFLEYLEGKVSDDPLVKEIEEEIHTVKQRKQEERDYMSYLMNIREEREEARAEGKTEGEGGMIIKMIKDNMHLDMIQHLSGWTADQIRALARKNGLAI